MQFDLTKLTAKANWVWSLYVLGRPMVDSMRGEDRLGLWSLLSVACLSELYMTGRTSAGMLLVPLKIFGIVKGLQMLAMGPDEAWAWFLSPK